MKRTALILYILLVYLPGKHLALAQGNCSNPVCVTDTINISTGYVHSTSSYLSPTSLEQNWKRVAVPSNAAMSPTGPSWVINPNMYWSNFSNAKWVSPLPTNAYLVNNWPPSQYGAFEFDNCFCVCSTGTVRIRFDMMFDDAAYVYIDNILISSGTAGFQFQYNNRMIVDTSYTLSAGPHCLKVKLYNGGSVAMGFTVQGYVASTANLQKPGCCNPTGKICGVKHRDANCDGTLDSTEMATGAAGVSLVLKDSNGTAIDTVVTDGVGNYCFNNLLPGTYTVAEGYNPSWIQTYPSSPGTYTFNLDTNEALLARFGNCYIGSIICGRKYKDKNCDGLINNGDPGMSGWSIVLMDSIGNPIDTAVTDYAGNYCFNMVAPGTHTIGELAQAGWGQTYPGAPGTHTLLVTALDTISGVDFANCYVANPCDSSVSFIEDINRCRVSFMPDLAAPLSVPGFTLISVLWTFGDGFSSTQLNPLHYYSSAGSFNVCLKILLFNAEQNRCCELEYCKQINVNEKCEGPCDIQADIVPEFDSQRCRYTFIAQVHSTNVPITSWFWDFGDGTSGTGPSVSHQFATPGSYYVCLRMYSEIEGRCCMVKICTEVQVDCEPCDANTDSWGHKLSVPQPADPIKKGASGNTATKQVNQGRILLSDKNIIVLNQNVPNPFAEHTLITYNIPTAFKKAQLLFFSNEGRIIRTVEIKEKGKGQLSVFGNDLSSGIYRYSLIVDGKTIDSKTFLKR